MCGLQIPRYQRVGCCVPCRFRGVSGGGVHAARTVVVRLFPSCVHGTVSKSPFQGWLVLLVSLCGWQSVPVSPFAWPGRSVVPDGIFLYIFHGIRHSPPLSCFFTLLHIGVVSVQSAMRPRRISYVFVVNLDLGCEISKKGPHSPSERPREVLRRPFLRPLEAAFTLQGGRRQGSVSPVLKSVYIFRMPAPCRFRPPPGRICPPPRPVPVRIRTRGHSRAVSARVLAVPRRVVGGQKELAPAIPVML